MILLAFQSPESAHLKDIKSLCILCPQEVTVTICVYLMFPLYRLWKKQEWSSD